MTTLPKKQLLWQWRRCLQLLGGNKTGYVAENPEAKLIAYSFIVAGAMYRRGFNADTKKIIERLSRRHTEITIGILCESAGKYTKNLANVYREHDEKFYKECRTKLEQIKKREEI